MVVQHFQNNFEFKSSNDRGEKKKGRGGGEDTSTFSTRIPKIHQGMPSHLSSQSSIRQQQTRGGVGFDTKRAAAELGSVFAVCFPSFE